MIHKYITWAFIHRTREVENGKLQDHSQKIMSTCFKKNDDLLTKICECINVMCLNSFTSEISFYACFVIL